MKINKRVLGTATVLTVAATVGTLMVGMTAASAAAPAWEPDTGNAVGTLTFYDASGNVISGGSTSTAPFAAYAVGSSVIRAGDAQAQLLFANPDHTLATTSWFKTNVGLYTANPTTTAPANINSLSSSHPVVAGATGDLTPDAFEGAVTQDTTAGYQNVIHIRLRTANSSNQPTAQYDDADILVNPTNHTWTQLYPAVASSTAVVASPSTVGQGSTSTLTATVTAPGGVFPAGTVQFADGGTNLGAAVAVNTTNGQAVGSFPTTTSTTLGAHSITAAFTPAAAPAGPTTGSGYTASTGTTSVTVTAPATPTTTSVAATQDGYAGDPITLTSTTTGPGTTANNAGTVNFYDGPTTGTPLNASPITPNASGQAVLNLPSGLAVGNHTINAVFTPTNPSAFTSSQGSTSFALSTKPTGACTQTGSSCTDVQNIQVEVPVGTLTISTPYTSANPLDLGTMTFVANGANSYFTATHAFGNITVVDMRSGLAGANAYTVSGLSSTLQGPGSGAGTQINAGNVGLTGVVVTPGSGFAGTTTVSNGAAGNPAANPPAAQSAASTAGLAANPSIFSATNSAGTVTAAGTLTITAPTSTEAGTFTGTITFTVG